MFNMTWLVNALHSFPHYSLKFKQIDAIFDPKSDDYLLSIGLWMCVALLVGLLLLLITTICWCVRCCCKRTKEPAKRLRKIKALSNGLFIISLLCFLWLGVSLFCNERVNRGMTGVGVNMLNLKSDLNEAMGKVESINRTLYTNFSGNFSRLFTTMDSVEKYLNESEKESFKELDTEVRENVSSDEIDSYELVNQLDLAFNDIDHMLRNTRKVSRIENERWISMAVIFSIMILVLFGGTVGFCRHSKKSAVLFSGLGMVIFILAWIIFSACVGLILMAADFCHDPKPFVWSELNLNSSRNMAGFYVTCHRQPSVELPDFILQSGTDIRNDLTEIEAKADVVKETVDKFSTVPKNIKSELELIQKDIKTMVIGMMNDLAGMEQELSCTGSLSRDFDGADVGLCHTAMSGLALMLLSLLLLGFFLFLLLIFVSKAWHLYTKRPMDYVEVEDEDPFLPRGDRSTIPADFYGTHVYNPRTRFASTNESEGEGSTPLWGRTAPPPPANWDPVIAMEKKPEPGILSGSKSKSLRKKGRKKSEGLRNLNPLLGEIPHLPWLRNSADSVEKRKTEPDKTVFYPTFESFGAIVPNSKGGVQANFGFAERKSGNKSCESEQWASIDRTQNSSDTFL